MKISKIWFANDRIYGLTDDGRELWQSLLYYRRLRNATDEERANYEIDDEGIHSHPELNASAVGRRLGISQSLMAQYINGTKKPSKERERLIMDEIILISQELQRICA